MISCVSRPARRLVSLALAAAAIVVVLGVAACASSGTHSSGGSASAGSTTYAGVSVSSKSSSGASARVSGTWKGTMTPSTGSHAKRHYVTVSDNSAEKSGTFYLSATCQGTLKLKDISNGFHHFTEIPAKGSSCRGGAEDCLKRVGGQVLDVYVSPPGLKDNSSGLLIRAA